MKTTRSRRRAFAERSASDPKRRRQLKRLERRPHEPRAGGRPDSLLGQPTAHWTQPAFRL